LLASIANDCGARNSESISSAGIRPSRNAARSIPEALRRVRYHDHQTGMHLVFLTNNFELPPLTIASIYRCLWQVELFFKWIKQHLRIKAFYGTSPNAVKTRISIAIAVYVLVAVVRKLCLAGDDRTLEGRDG
jgi:IS4 transposase